MEYFYLRRQIKDNLDMMKRFETDAHNWRCFDKISLFRVNEDIKSKLQLLFMSCVVNHKSDLSGCEKKYKITLLIDNFPLISTYTHITCVGFEQFILIDDKECKWEDVEKLLCPWIIDKTGCSREISSLFLRTVCFTTLQD